MDWIGSGVAGLTQSNLFEASIQECGYRPSGGVPEGANEMINDPKKLPSGRVFERGGGANTRIRVNG
jgi:hypothetical protein